MGLWSGITSVVSSFSSALSAVSNAVSSAFGSISDIFKSTLSNLHTVIPTISTVLSALAIPFPQLRIAATICDVALTVMGLLNANETSEELGNRVLQGYEADIKPSDFSSYDEYIAEIRAMPLDPEKSKNFNAGEKIIAGLSTLAWGMEHKFGQDSSEMLNIIIKDSSNMTNDTAYFTETKVEAIFSTIKDVSELVDYFKDRLSPESASKVESQLVKIEKGLTPEKPIDDIYKDLDNLIEK